MTPDAGEPPGDDADAALTDGEKEPPAAESLKWRNNFAPVSARRNHGLQPVASDSVPKLVEGVGTKADRHFDRTSLARTNSGC